MKVRIQSSLTEPVNGILDIECNPSSTPGSVIQSFFKKKGMQLLPPNVSLYNLYYQPLKPGVTLESLGIKDGSTLLLGCRSDADNVSSMLKWRVLAFIICILAVCGIVTVCLLHSLSGGEIPYDYGIVMDAGSTHTQVTLYRWKGDKDEGTGEVLQIDTCKIDGGIHTFVNFTEAGKSLLPCLKNLSVSVPDNRISTTPVYLGATAGMRLLNLTNPLLTKAILVSIHDTLKTDGYDVKDVDIISGQSEGLFAWTTANFLSDKLEHKQKENSTVGTLDLGGASTQIAYEVKDRKEIENDTVTTLTLYGNKHDIFSESYLCFGVNEAIRRYHAALVLEDVNKTIIDDPCGLTGDTVNYTADFLFNHPCSVHENGKNWFDSDLNFMNTYIFNGLGDTAQCANAVAKVMNFSVCQESYRYCFRPLHQSLTDAKYMAISTYYYLAKFLKINMSDSNMEQYETAMNTFCNTSYEDALKIDPEEDEYVSNFCFEAHYIFYVLTEEYGFNATSWRNIAFINKIHKFNVGWSLGYMINATTLIPSEKPQPPLISTGAFVAASIVCLTLLVLSVIFIGKLCFRRSQTGYTRISEA
ncbi:ectonucleoside triphosphate diphosphohydrolase 2-like isoform X1 [Centruroides sculpturatus]|uniref:ectonucleoside triphosphate diphosphohydrolase 2-like isoform X1 n=2 Tax=Centruroides sculpturatus TaxID=218467 RepID=UPI000C6EECA3|nr:ectonucleoside triphosphate diphosphohydrolase 2-like isoform X1 [Centruroides sculpturatus]XP_023217280.1 ectonucleoside triphosphate diphosphohydrolase 2-like isoform X1 [Centruroides sculpturatus]XP_023217281.1 ectonucleoside triphosphate diphosphohydrolase 2-like isoform X1 [Centruroides sculpturatus]